MDLLFFIMIDHSSDLKYLFKYKNYMLYFKFLY